MFSGFWGWFLVVVVVAAIFGAGKLPELKQVAEEKFKFLADAAQKGKKELEAKINETKKNREEVKEAKKEDNAEEKKDGE